MDIDISKVDYISDLDYIMYFCVDGKRIMRVHCNFLMPNSINSIKQWVSESDQNFYTHIEFVYKRELVSVVQLGPT